ncbi:helix-turn-helix transcriptional regulator [Jannaschia sp. M317]|uniref:helix-turn-helix domain-containing protein n=1 Tax=Jannaschia sp. M317 TaxID=2867011 RepID=UPI0021A7AE22|nr:helix-turn-helix transcriptional regulator [Jannaschia sp. M317]UWQ16137.1 helix-turn-helix domain-containing protein [Jannaschia sp. M317]
MNDIHTRLRVARETAGYETAADAARRLGMKVPTYTGHENGSRGIKADTIRSYARAFKVDEQWLLFGKGRGPGAVRGSTADGFSEPALVPFEIRETSNRPAFLASALEITEKGKTLFLLNRSYPELHLLVGDILVVNLNPSHTTDTLAIINYADPNTGEAETVVQRLLQGRPIPALDPGQQPTVRGQGVTMGLIEGVIRSF